MMQKTITSPNTGPKTKREKMRTKFFVRNEENPISYLIKTNNNYRGDGYNRLPEKISEALAFAFNTPNPQFTMPTQVVELVKILHSRFGTPKLGQRTELDCLYEGYKTEQEKKEKMEKGLPPINVPQKLQSCFFELAFAARFHQDTDSVESKIPGAWEYLSEMAREIITLFAETENKTICKNFWKDLLLISMEYPLLYPPQIFGHFLKLKKLLDLSPKASIRETLEAFYEKYPKGLEASVVKKENGVMPGNQYALPLEEKTTDIKPKSQAQRDFETKFLNESFFSIQYIVSSEQRPFERLINHEKFRELGDGTFVSIGSGPKETALMKTRLAGCSTSLTIDQCDQKTLDANALHLRSEGIPGFAELHKKSTFSEEYFKNIKHEHLVAKSITKDGDDIGKDWQKIKDTIFAYQKINVIEDCRATLLYAPDQVQEYLEFLVITAQEKAKAQQSPIFLYLSRGLSTNICTDLVLKVETDGTVVVVDEESNTNQDLKNRIYTINDINRLIENAYPEETNFKSLYQLRDNKQKEADFAKKIILEFIPSLEQVTEIDIDFLIENIYKTIIQEVHLNGNNFSDIASRYSQYFSEEEILLIFHVQIGIKGITTAAQAPNMPNRAMKNFQEWIEKFQTFNIPCTFWDWENGINKHEKEKGIQKSLPERNQWRMSEKFLAQRDIKEGNMLSNGAYANQFRPSVGRDNVLAWTCPDYEGFSSPSEEKCLKQVCPVCRQGDLPNQGFHHAKTHTSFFHMYEHTAYAPESSVESDEKRKEFWTRHYTDFFEKLAKSGVNIKKLVFKLNKGGQYVVKKSHFPDRTLDNDLPDEIVKNLRFETDEFSAEFLRTIGKTKWGIDETQIEWHEPKVKETISDPYAEPRAGTQMEICCTMPDNSLLEVGFLARMEFERQKEDGSLAYAKDIENFAESGDGSEVLRHHQDNVRYIQKNDALFTGVLGMERLEMATKQYDAFDLRKESLQAMAQFMEIPLETLKEPSNEHILGIMASLVDLGEMIAHIKFSHPEIEPKKTKKNSPEKELFRKYQTILSLGRNLSYFDTQTKKWKEIDVIVLMDRFLQYLHTSHPAIKLRPLFSNVAAIIELENEGSTEEEKKEYINELKEKLKKAQKSISFDGEFAKKYKYYFFEISKLLDVLENESDAQKIQNVLLKFHKNYKENVIKKQFSVSQFASKQNTQYFSSFAQTTREIDGLPLPYLHEMQKILLTTNNPLAKIIAGKKLENFHQDPLLQGLPKNIVNDFCEWAKALANSNTNKEEEWDNKREEYLPVQKEDITQKFSEFLKKYGVRQIDFYEKDNFLAVKNAMHRLANMKIEKTYHPLEHFKPDNRLEEIFYDADIFYRWDMQDDNKQPDFLKTQRQVLRILSGDDTKKKQKLLKILFPKRNIESEIPSYEGLKGKMEKKLKFLNPIERMLDRFFYEYAIPKNNPTRILLEQSLKIYSTTETNGYNKKAFVLQKLQKNPFQLSPAENLSMVDEYRNLLEVEKYKTVSDIIYEFFEEYHIPLSHSSVFQFFAEFDTKKTIEDQKKCFLQWIDEKKFPIPHVGIESFTKQLITFIDQQRANQDGKTVEKTAKTTRKNLGKVGI